MNYLKTAGFLIILYIVMIQSACAQPLQTGAEQADAYLPLLKGKRVGVTANHTSMIGEKHLVDVLLEKKVNVVRIYAPEHGFRGTADAGENVNTAKDAKTGIEIASIYGNTKKPTPAQLKGIDCMLFDMQDVGVRFFTYISTMHYVMEACAEQGIPVMVLDRPNPNGFYVDGPVLELKNQSFVGMHPIPVVHGMTVGELATMMNEEAWLKNKVHCELTVISCKNYTHKTLYELPVKPSPNLPGMQAVYLYPSTCYFEGTVVSLGRGTDYPFQVFGHPAYKGIYTFTFTPHSIEGAKNPPLLDKLCYGVDLRNFPQKELIAAGKIHLEWLVEAYANYPDKAHFFTTYSTKLWGTERVQKLIAQNCSADEIRASWQKELSDFKQLRKKYLLYPDFE